MFNSPFLDIAISLGFTYLLIAIIVSSINEWLLNSVLNSRAKDLKNAIENLFFDPQWKVIASDIINSPFISSLKKSKEIFPSYIPAKNFAMAVTDVIKENGKELLLTNTLNMEMLKKLVYENNLVTGDTQKVLAGLIDRAESSFEKFQENLEQFYDDAMHRANGWYKRKAKRVNLIIAIIIAFSLNIDTIRIAKTLWEQPQLAREAANLATINISGIDTTGGRYAIAESKIAHVDTTIKRISESGDTTVVIVNREIKNMQNANSLLGKLSLPMGWVDANYPGSAGTKSDFLGWLSKFIGLLLTAGAVSLGAPFWFDIVNKFINIRSSGSKPELSTKNSKSVK